LSLVRLTGLRGRALARLVAAGFAFLATLAITVFNQHAPYDISPGLVAQLLTATVPLAAAIVTGYAVLRPWPAYLAVVLLTPYWDMAQVSWRFGAVQVIAQTVFVAALGLGFLLREEVTPGSIAAHARSLGRGSVTLVRMAGGALAGLLLLAALSTAFSPDVTTSAAVLLHGILEPVAMGLLLVLLRPTVRALALVAVVLGISVGLGGLLNMIQTLPAIGTLAALQADRLLFSRLTYFNVGLFGAILAMAMPLLLAALVARRRLGLNRAVVAVLLVALAACLASLFLTFSKSAWLATAAGSAVLILLVVQGWRRRAAIILVGGLLSTAVIPWPAFVLQVAPPVNDAYRTVMVRLIGESRFDSWNPSTLSGRGSLLERFYATRAAAEMAVDHPLLGIGLDQFKTQYVAGRYRPPEAHLALDSAHTFWPEIAAELGFPALAMVVLVFAAALLALWRVYRAPPDELTRILAATLLAALAAWLVVATTFDIDLYRDWRNMASDVIMAAVITAAAFALYRHVRAESEVEVEAAR
jgi:O-antigen ligase